MTWYSVVGLISVTTLFLPIIVILAFRLAWYKSFPALLVYYIIVFGYNVLTLDFVGLDNRFTYYFGVVNNLLDAPLMLAFMTYFSKTAIFRKRMLMIIPIFILFEIIVIGMYGLNVGATVIVMGPGLLMILILSLLFFFHQAKITIIHQKAAGKAFIVTSLLFAYGGYSFIYIVYYVMHSPYKTDTYIVYYLITIFSSLLLSTGVYLERKRVKQLSEVQTTRKELKIIYGGNVI
jgi:hypothetical protein